MAVACGDDASKSSGTPSNNSTSSNNTAGEVLVKPGTNEACGLAGRTGENMCGLSMITCQAGQYCDNEFCSPGCTSDNNCAGNQFCSITEGSLGTCLNCVKQTQQSSNNTSTNNTSSNNTSGVSPACETIVNAGVTCELIEANESAAAKTACTAEPAADANVVLTCVNAANADCAQITQCFGGASGCETDNECDQEASQFHEICSGGSCTFGCRVDADCGQDYICDLELGFGDAGGCTPDF